MANTPNHMSDTGIHALHELEHETIYLRSAPAEDWHIDIDDDGAMVGKCPRCSSREISAVTPERLQCRDCGHTDGQQYRTVGHGSFEPAESVAVRGYDEALDE
jgi:ribosomal protein S27AE